MLYKNAYPITGNIICVIFVMVVQYAVVLFIS